MSEIIEVNGEKRIEFTDNELVLLQEAVESGTPVEVDDALDLLAEKQAELAEADG